MMDHTHHARASDGYFTGTGMMGMIPPLSASTTGQTFDEDVGDDAASAELEDLE